ncbi:hypothetical protein MKW92_020133, partial [Papaver armeniacum]
MKDEHAGSISLAMEMFTTILSFCLVITSVRIAKLELVLGSIGTAKLKFMNPNRL